MSEPTIREPDQIRQDRARKLRRVQVSEHFQAILAGPAVALDRHAGLQRKTHAITRRPRTSVAFVL